MINKLTIIGLSLILITGVIMQAEANGNGNSDPKAKVRAIQLGNSLSTDPGTEGILGVDIDCVGGIEYQNANDFHCFLVPAGVAPGQYDWDQLIDGQNLPSGVMLLSTTNPITCPTGVGFGNKDKCFSVTFDGSNFNQPAHWHFIGVFTENGNVIGITGNNEFKVHSFMVLPEAAIGAVAILGSIFAAFIGYNYLRKN